MTLSRILSLSVALLILLGSGAMYQSLAGDSAQLDVTALRLAEVPMQIGDWHGSVTSDGVDKGLFASAGAKGYWVRTYVHKQTKIPLVVILMCGRAGKMAVHTPEICYGGAGFSLTQDPAPFSLKNELGEETSRFWTADFTKKPGKSRVRLFWGWSAEGVWDAAPRPRWQYRGQPYLCKLYVSRDLTVLPNVAAQADPAMDFLSKLVPALGGTLFASDRTP